MTNGYIGSGGEPPELETASAALTILRNYFPDEADQERAHRNFVDLMASEFRRSGLTPPDWLNDLRIG